MSIVKVIEVLAQSDKSWEDATEKAVAEAGRSINNIQSVYLKNFQAIVREDRVTEYRVDAKISFVVEK